MSQRGFTLIEAMIVVAIISILIAIAEPNYARTLEAYQTRAVANELYTDIYWAKEEAIKRGNSVKVNFTSTGWQITLADGTRIKSYVTPYTKVGLSGDTGFTFDSVRGLTNANVVSVAAAAGTVTLSVVALGYADICSNDIGGFHKC